jgi:hypothetical protein
MAAAGALIVFGTTISYGIGWVIGIPALVPILNTLASFPFMVAALRRRDLPDAVARMLLWALTMAIAATVLSYAYPADTESLFLRSGDYRREMFTWVLTGHGAESTPSIFIPQQAGHAALFSALAVATGGVLAMPMGAVLMNYMGHYVGTLAGIGRHPALLMLLGWHPWAVIRVISFVVLGVVLSAPLLSRLFRFQVDWPVARRLAAWAGCGLLADIVLKTLLAPTWQRLLVRMLG